MLAQRNVVVVLLCSYSPYDVPPPSPEPQRNMSIAAVRGAVRQLVIIDFYDKNRC